MSQAFTKIPDAGLRTMDGFANQRLVILPERVINRCRDMSFVSGLYVTHIGSFPVAPHHYVERTSGAPQAIFIYCLEGSGGLQLKDRKFRVEHGDAILIPPDIPHSYYADEDDPWSIFWIHFQGSMIEDAIGWTGVSEDNPLLHAPDTALMHKLFENVYACLRYNYSNDGLLAMSSELLRFISQMKLHLGSRSSDVRRETDMISQVMEYMQENLGLNLSLEEMARQANQSVSSFSKRFHEIAGESPVNYHIQLKMRKACEMLDQTEMQVSEIAEVLGYSDPGYFSRYFKKFQGCSPATYRESLKS